MARVRTTTKVLCLSDLHIPFVDAQALAVVERFKRDFKPDVTVALGDWIDGSAVSTFNPDVTDFDQLDEYDMGNNMLDRFQPDVFIAGNHEERFYRQGNLRQQYRRLLDPRKWLHLNRRGIRFFPYSHFRKDIFRLGKLTFIHGFNFSKHAAMHTAQRFGHAVFGHTHRIQQYTVPHVSEPCTAFNIGCLCDLEQEYVATRQPHGWEHGFGYGYIYKSGNYSFHIAKLSGDTVHLEGKEYRV